MSGIPIQQVGTTQPSPLHVDFNPVNRGTFQGQTVRLSSPNQPLRRHAPPMTIGERILNVFSKVRNAIVTNSSQSSIAFKMGLRGAAREANQLTSLLLAKDAQGTPSKANLVSVTQTLIATAEPCTRRGANLDALIKARFDVILQGLDSPQIDSLKQTLANLQQDQTTQNPQVDAVLSHLSTRIAAFETAFAQQVIGTLRPDINQLLANPNATNWQSVVKNAQNVLHQNGMAVSNKPAFALIKVALHEQTYPLLEQAEVAVSTCISQDQANQVSAAITLPIQNLKAFLSSSLSHRDLADLQNAFLPILNSLDDSTSTTMIMSCVADRCEALETAARSSIDQLGTLLGSMSVPSSANAVALIKAVNLIKQEKEGYQVTENLFGAKSIDLSPDLAAANTQCTTHAQEVSQVLTRLSINPLLELAQTSRNLKLDALSNLIDAEIQNRKDALKDDFATTYMEMMEAAKSGDSLAMLKATRAHVMNADKIIQKLEILGEKIDGPDAIYKFRSDNSKHALSKLSVDDRLDYLKVFNLPSIKILSENLCDIAYSSLAQSTASPVNQLGLQMEILSDITNFQRVEEQLRSTFDGSDIELPDPVSYEKTDLGDLSPSQKMGIQDHYGISIAQNKTLSQTKPLGLRSIELSLLSPLPDKDQILTGVSIDAGTGVATLLDVDSPVVPDVLIGGTFLVDVNRATYQFLDSSGQYQPILDREGFSSLTPTQQDQAKAQAAAKLLQEIGDPALAQRFTQVVHQGILASLFEVLSSSNSPIQLQGLGAGHLINGKTTNVYSLNKLPNGDLQIQVQQDLTQATHFMSISDQGIAETHEIDPSRSSMSISFGITLKTDSEFVVHQQPSISYSIA